MLATVGLVFGFRSSTNLAAAYGIAVTTTMVITTDAGVRRGARAVAAGASGVLPAPCSACSSLIDLAFFGANVIKIEHGGWFPLVVAGADLYRDDHVAPRPADGRGAAGASPRCRSTRSSTRSATHPPVRVPGTGVFMTARPQGAPPILVHHLTHNKCLHRCVVLLTVSIADTPAGQLREPRRGACAPARLLPRDRALWIHGNARMPLSLKAADLRRWSTPAATTSPHHLRRLHALRHRAHRHGALARAALHLPARATPAAPRTSSRLPPDRVVEIGFSWNYESLVSSKFEV